MERLLVFSRAFDKSYAKLIRGNPVLERAINDSLSRLHDNPFGPGLRTHALKGKLASLLSCSCGYDCLIIFEIHTRQNGQEVIFLMRVGKHDDVY